VEARGVGQGVVLPGSSVGLIHLQISRWTVRLQAGVAEVYLWMTYSWVGGQARGPGVDPVDSRCGSKDTGRHDSLASVAAKRGHW
jgi:hypothetical protein